MENAHAVWSIPEWTLKTMKNITGARRLTFFPDTAII